MYFCAIAALLAVMGCDPRKPAAVPAELLGTWRTQDPRYAGVFFKIESGNFSFATVEGNVESYAIIKYEQPASRPDARVPAHVLHGSRDGQKLQVTLVYESLGGGRLKFKNQDKVFWTRDEGHKQ
jgi:hypothetical protein